MDVAGDRERGGAGRAGACPSRASSVGRSDCEAPGSA
jgi:hypothetical protein